MAGSPSPGGKVVITNPQTADKLKGADTGTNLPALVAPPLSRVAALAPGSALAEPGERVLRPGLGLVAGEVSLLLDPRPLGTEQPLGEPGE